MRLSALQDTPVKVASAITVTANDLLSVRKYNTLPDLRKAIAKLIAAVVLLGHVNTKLTFKRRDVLYPNIGNKCKQACSRWSNP